MVASENYMNEQYAHSPEKGHAISVVTGVGQEPRGLDHLFARDFTGNHAFDHRTRCARGPARCAVMVQVSSLGRDIPQIPTVDTYRVVCERSCESELPRVDATEMPQETSVQIS